MSKIVKFILGICCVFVLIGCQSGGEENNEINNTLSQEQEEDNDSTSITSNSKYIGEWNTEKIKLFGCIYNIMTPINMTEYQEFNNCNKFIFHTKDNREVKIMFNSSFNFDGSNATVDLIDNQMRILRDTNLNSIYFNDGNVQYNEQFENVTVAGYDALLDKGIAKDSTGDLFNYAIYQLYLGEEKDGICELLVGSEEMDSDSLAEIGEELIATIEPME